MHKGSGGVRRYGHLDGFESNPGSFYDEIVIGRRFRGPEESGNGGYTCGLVAAFVDAPSVEVTLRLPPPLDTPLRVERNGEVRVLDGDRLVAEAKPAELELEVRPPVAYDDAVRLSDAQPPDPDHPFPHCFVCGPEGDGFRFRPAAAGDDSLVVPWRVVEPGREFVWAALDCPGGHAVEPKDGVRGRTVLGRLTARIDEAPAVGDECVVVAWPLGGEGRRLFAGTALYRGDSLLASASAVWFRV